MRIMFTVVDGSDNAHDIILHADAETPVVAVAKLLATSLNGMRPGGPGVELYSGDAVLPPAMSLAASSIRDGQRIGLGRPLDEPAEHPGVLELCVVAGPPRRAIYA